MSTSPSPLAADLRATVAAARRELWDELRGEQVDHSHWVGELSSSALSTATAVVALSLAAEDRHVKPIAAGLRWLQANVNSDGGFGDTTRSRSNLSTTFLVQAAFAIAGRSERDAEVRGRAERWVAAAGGTSAILAKYGDDRTFSVPILMMGALGGLVPWKAIPRLPFELAALPQSFYAAMRLPVVSYAMPALIAIGQLLHEKNPTRSPQRWVRNATRTRTLRKLEALQPANGGFLEATPLTSFVTMSLASMGQLEHRVTRRGVGFLLDSQRDDGSWPIDTHLATWVTTLSINALGRDARDWLPKPAATLDWLLGQQYSTPHPFTGASPGGWAWTPLPGGVPDADDTAGAVRALSAIGQDDARATQARDAGLRWLHDLTNRDGGTPTFCRGWGTLPFDCSTPELTAHRLAAMASHTTIANGRSTQANRSAVAAAAYLARTQRADHCWSPLWFGNEHAADEANLVYGTGRMLEAWDSTGPEVQAAAAALAAQQNPDGGFGGQRMLPSTVEETAIAIAGLAAAWQRGIESFDPSSITRATQWLLEALRSGHHHTANPIGLYFANLWYHERLYPHTFALTALTRLLGRQLEP